MVVYPAFLLVECVVTYNDDPDYKIAINLNNIVNIAQIDMSDGKPPHAIIHLSTGEFHVTTCTFDELMARWGNHFSAPKPITSLLLKIVSLLKTYTEDDQHQPTETGEKGDSA